MKGNGQTLSFDPEAIYYADGIANLGALQDAMPGGFTVHRKSEPMSEDETLTAYTFRIVEKRTQDTLCEARDRDQRLALKEVFVQFGEVLWNERLTATEVGAWT